VPMPPGSAGGHSGFLFHAFIFARACFVVHAGSVYVALGVRMFESMMLRMHRTRALPLLVSALVLASYVLFALVLLLFEHGDWQGVAQLQRERNVWVVMFGAVTMQAGAVQALGALADSYRYEACFSMSCVGATAGVREAQMIGALAKHLKGVAAADISLSAKASTIKEGDAFAAMASGLAAKMMKTTPEARAAQRLLEKARLREAEVEVTEVTVTIATKHKLVAKQTTVRLQNLTARTLNAVLADSLGGAMTIQRLSKVSTSEELLNTGWRSWALAYAQFYQRMADQMMTLIIFATLLVLSFLPILRLQTSILFNRQFADILNRKIHKQEVLDDLYTPGMFYQVEADDDPSKDRAKKSPMLAMLRAKVPGAPGVLGAFSKAKGGLKLPGLGTPKADSGTSSTKPSDELDTVSV